MTCGGPLGTFAAAVAVSMVVSLAPTPRSSPFGPRSLGDNVRYIRDWM